MQPKRNFSATVEGWQVNEPFQETADVGGLKIYLAGWHATHPQFGDVVGSAASVQESPLERAWYELLERITILRALSAASDSIPMRGLQPSQDVALTSVAQAFAAQQVEDQHADYRLSKSNGIAIFTDWQSACERAALELVERHLVLSSWLGFTPVKMMKHTPSASMKCLEPLYDVKPISFGMQQVDAFKAPIHAAGVALMPKDLKHPLILAFGAEFDERQALAKAESECLQRLGFLWGESIPAQEPEFAPTTLYHQEYFLWPAKRRLIEQWVGNKFYAPSSTVKPLAMTFADLSKYASHGLFVAKAIAPDAIPLVFGKWRGGAFMSIPQERMIHPIA